jgi:hypothetical protein
VSHRRLYFPPPLPPIIGYVGPLEAELTVPLAEQATAIDRVLDSLAVKMKRAGANRLVQLSIDMDPFTGEGRLRVCAVCTGAVVQGG